MSRTTPETKWYVTEYPEECDFAVTDGNEIIATIIGGDTIGNQCDLASRIAKLPDLERELAEAIDKYQSLQKTFEEWQLKFLSEQAELLHNKDVQRDKLFDEAHQIRIERDEARDALEHAQMTIGSIVSPSDKATLELIKVTKERDEAREALMKIEDRCVDCEDACDDIQKIRDIAVKALEGIPERHELYIWKNGKYELDP